MILLAGVGSRLDPLTRDTPKPLAPVLGKPVVQHIVSLCKEHGYINFAANTHVLAHKIHEHFKNAQEKFGISLNMVHEENLTGIAGGIRSCRKFLTQDVILIIMGDALTDLDLSYLYDRHIKSNCAVTVGIMEVEDTSQYGVVVTDKNDRIISFQEKPKPHEAKSNLANTAIYFFNQNILKEIPTEHEAPMYDVATDLFSKLMKKNIPMQGININAYWADIGTRKQYKQSIKDTLEGKVKIKINASKTSFGFKEEGVYIDPQAKIEGKVYLGRNVKIQKGAVITGPVYIEKDCTIEENSIVEDSIIWSWSRIAKDSKLINSMLGNNCHLKDGIVTNSVWGPGSIITKSLKPEFVLS